LETAKSHSEPNQGNWVGISFWDRNYLTECHMSWTIGIVQNSITGQSSGLFLFTDSCNCFNIST